MLRHKQLTDRLSAEDVARLHSMSSKGSLAFVSAIPSSPDLLIPSYLMPTVISSFLGAPFPLRQPQHCLCQKELDSQGLHLSLGRFRAPQHLHDMVCSAVMDLGRQAGCHVSPASSLSHIRIDDNKLPDFRISSSSPSGIDTMVDVQIRNPCAPSSFDNQVIVSRYLPTLSSRKTASMLLLVQQLTATSFHLSSKDLVR